MRLQKKILALVHRYLPSGHIMSQSMIIIGSSVAINLLMFGYNAYLGRKLALVDFGLIAFIGSLLSVLYIPLGSFTRTITHQTAYLFGKYNQPNKKLWNQHRRISLAISLVLTLVWIASIPILKKFFKVSESLPFVLLIPMWLVSIAAAIDSGYLAGIQKFKQLSLIDLFEAICLVVVTVLLIETQSAQFLYVAITLSSIISFLLGWITIKRINSTPVVSTQTESFSFPWNFYHHSLLTKLASATFINVDVILAKHYLNPHAAGEYALLALVGKMIFFVSTLLGQFVVPIVSKQVGSGENPKRIFTKMFSFTLVIVLLGYIAVGLMGTFTLPILFGEKALVITKYLPLYALGMASFGLAHLLLSYYQSLHRYSYTATSIVASALIMAGILLFHNSVADISSVVGMAGISSLALVSLMRYWFKLDKQLIMLVFSTLISKMRRSGSKEQFIGLPKKAGQFTLLSTFKKPGMQAEYLFGIYTDPNGSKALGKFWHGHTRNAAFFYLQNELVVSQAIENVNKKMGNKWAKRVAIPKIVYSQQDKKSLLVLLEWIEAEPSARANDAGAWQKTFALIRHYYQALSEVISVDATLPKRTALHMLLIYPCAFFKACQSNPTHLKLLLQSMIVFAQGIPEILKKRPLVLSHRDSHPDNVITHKQKAYIIDHAYSLLTLAPYDQLATIALTWTDRKLRKLLLNELEDTITTKSQLRLIKALGVYISTLYLMHGNRPGLRAQKYDDYLQYWVHSISMRPVNQRMFNIAQSNSLSITTGR